MVGRMHPISPVKALLALFVACSLVFVCAEAWAWQTNVAGTAGGGVFNATTIDGAGNVVAAGSINTAGVGSEFMVVKFDGASGAELWRSVFGTENGSAARAVTIDGAGNVVAAGTIVRSSGGPGFEVKKLDGATGVELWRSGFNLSGNDWANAVALDGAGNVVAAGLITQNSAGNFAVMKFDGASGTQLWLQAIPGGRGQGGGHRWGRECGHRRHDLERRHRL